MLRTIPGHGCAVAAHHARALAHDEAAAVLIEGAAPLRGKEGRVGASVLVRCKVVGHPSFESIATQAPPTAASACAMGWEARPSACVAAAQAEFTTVGAGV